MNFKNPRTDTLNLESEMDILNRDDVDYSVSYSINRDGDVTRKPQTITAEKYADRMSGLDKFPEDDYRDLSS